MDRVVGVERKWPEPPWKATISLIITWAVLMTFVYLADRYRAPVPDPVVTTKAPHCELGVTLHIVKGQVNYRESAVICQSPGAGWVIAK